MTGPGFIRPTEKGLRLPVEADIGECQYVKHDTDEVVRSASERLTYAHRVDNSPLIDDWAVEELDFHVRHVEKLSGFQVQALSRIKRWMALELKLAVDRGNQG